MRDETAPAAPAFDSRAFRRCLSSFPTGVTVITTGCPDGEKAGVTVNSFASVSLEPPLILWSLASKAGSRHLFERHSHFVVNILADEQQALSDQFARAFTDKWHGVAYHHDDAGCPVLEGACAHLHCRTVEIKEAGDHLIFLAAVESIATREDLHPLICCRGSYMSAAAAAAC
jgi:flavin reductase (DIM6/NTAB) family NADH-FMN oxidoreductase RutF